jgi:hypothetical protein
MHGEPAPRDDEALHEEQAKKLMQRIEGLVIDMAHIGCGRDGWAHRVAVIDCHDRDIIGWELALRGRTNDAEVQSAILTADSLCGATTGGRINHSAPRTRDYPIQERPAVDCKMGTL